MTARAREAAGRRPTRLCASGKGIWDPRPFPGTAALRSGCRLRCAAEGAITYSRAAYYSAEVANVAVDLAAGKPKNFRNRQGWVFHDLQLAKGDGVDVPGEALLGRGRCGHAHSMMRADLFDLVYRFYPLGHAQRRLRVQRHRGTPKTPPDGALPRRRRGPYVAARCSAGWEAARAISGPFVSPLLAGWCVPGLLRLHPALPDTRSISTSPCSGPTT